MNRQTIINVSAYGILAFAGAGGFMLPSHDVITHASAEPAAAVDVIYLTGPIRDFQESHPDFNVVPSDGYGHYAGNVAQALADGRYPGFTGFGAKVQTQWRDRATEAIPPHMYLTVGQLGPLSIPVVTEGEQPTQGMFDSWDSSVGPYGGSNIGVQPHYVPGATMPTIEIPPSLTSLVNQGIVQYNSDTTISSDLHCDELIIASSTTITIEGDVTILCEQDFLLQTLSSLELAEDATLTMYLLNGGREWNHVEVNVNTADPSRVTIYLLGNEEFMVHNHAILYANFIAPDAPLNLTNNGSLFGTYIGETILFSNHGDFHLDTTGNIPKMCGEVLADSAGAWGNKNAGTISTAETFSQWYRDVAGTNLSLPHTIGLERQPDGVYEFTDGEFYPIDDQLYGNEGEAHNHYFTYTVHARFVFNSCTNQFIELAGADDIWLYVDGRLGIDLGGILAKQTQHLSMDRMNLTDGETYTIRLYFAQRQGSQSAFSIRTNIPLSSTELGSVSAGFD